MNRRTPADDVTTTTTTLMITTTTNIIVEDKTSGMRHIAIAILAEDAETPVRRAITDVEPDDLVNRVTLQRESTIHDPAEVRVRRAVTPTVPAVFRRTLD